MLTNINLPNVISNINLVPLIGEFNDKSLIAAPKIK